MKNISFHIILIILIGIVSSCTRSSSNLDVDLSNYNPDNFVRGELDHWIDETLTKPYNIEIVYRFNRSMSDIAKNVSPPNVDRVQPTAEMVLDGFLKVYEKVAGKTFIRKYAPKQFVFFGSTVYNSNGTETLGTADAGRRIVLYNLNTLNEGDHLNIKRRLRTIHHEFAHILNQLFVIPPSFELVTPGDYTSDWTGKSADEAKNLGFISPYARAEFSEDFAETIAHLLVEGQLYYDRYANSSTEEGKVKLKRKEAIVVDYFKQFFNIDFRELQYEMYLALNKNYNDPTETVLHQLKNGFLKTITVDLKTGSHYIQFGESQNFRTVWNDVVTKLAQNINGSAGRYPERFAIQFESANKMILQVFYRSATGTSDLQGNYDFTIIYQNDGNIRFTYVPNSIDQTQYNNGRAVIQGWQPLIDYFTANEFVSDWLPVSAGLANLRKFAGFQLKDDASNYFYGPIVLN
ncbi:substrate import-associated zinc metallohydrolase lipoprotein [Sphingobacterium bovisgrunnientis]|jgi:substrate import-associated zinc metallohydrolase lipoprotein|uniref:substrate import-associated zinc metallohydrolase lipoprotein n=1 Tax=Sphingobacterium bovisgrunnientis TaxID=1874697 RepID=UPI0013579454|nr:substrate import-associated zinc metallohydrolase lipoprotein [Sphingobacterium bovisgrunnientis]